MARTLYKTYQEAHAAIMSFLARDGWRIQPRLKIPHATNPDATTRLYFKAQAIYIARAPDLSPGAAHSMQLYSDIKNFTAADFQRVLAKNEKIKDEINSNHL